MGRASTKFCFILIVLVVASNLAILKAQENEACKVDQQCDDLCGEGYSLCHMGSCWCKNARNQSATNCIEAGDCKADQHCDKLCGKGYSVCHEGKCWCKSTVNQLVTDCLVNPRECKVDEHCDRLCGKGYSSCHNGTCWCKTVNQSATNCIKSSDCPGKMCTCNLHTCVC